MYDSYTLHSALYTYKVYLYIFFINIMFALDAPLKNH